MTLTESIWFASALIAGPAFFARVAIAVRNRVERWYGARLEQRTAIRIRCIGWTP